jgi:hypothetical protein
MHPEAASCYRVLSGEGQPPNPERRLQHLSSESSPSVLAPGPVTNARNSDSSIHDYFALRLSMVRAATEKSQKGPDK